MIKEITKYIENNTSLVIRENLFAGHRPPTARDRCSAVLEGAGGSPSFDLPDSIEMAIQVLSRAKTYFTARSDAYLVYALLHGKAGITLPKVESDEFYANVIEAQNVPQYVGQDEKKLYEFSTNYIFRIKNK